MRYVANVTHELANRPEIVIDDSIEIKERKRET